MLKDGAVWVKFTDRFDYRPSYGVVIAYKPGVYNVPTAAATLAVAAGKAVRLKKTNKDSAPWPENEPEPAHSASA